MQTFLKKNHLVIITVVIAITVVIYKICAADTKPVDTARPAAENGVLDLSGWDFNRDGNINLNGEWEFYWNRLLLARDFADADAKPDALVHVPGVWNKYPVNGQKCSGFGYATYMLTVKNAGSRELALRIPNLSSSYRLYVDDTLIASDGKTGADDQTSSPSWHLRTATFQPPAEVFRIVIQVSNFTYPQGGMWHPISMGSIGDVTSYSSNIIRKDMFLIGGILIASFFSFGIYFIQRKQRILLYFGLICLMVVIRMSLFDSLFIYSVFPGASYEQILFLAYIAVCWAPIITVFFVSELFPDYAPGFLNKLIWIPVLETLLSIILPAPVYLQFSYAVTFIAVAEIILVMAVLLKAFINQAKDSGTMLMAAGIATAAIIHDALYQQYIVVESSMALNPFGFYIFIFMQAYVIARVYYRINEENETMGMNLADSLSKEKELTERLARLDELKDEFLANTSHDLRTPLNAIINIADGLANRNRGRLEPDQAEGLQLISASGKKLACLVNDILDYSKMKHGDVKLNLSGVDLKELTLRVVAVFQYLQASNQVAVFADMSDALPEVRGDSARIIQILNNLIENALKFTRQGYVKITARLAGEFVAVSVEDTGIGIPENKHDDIFKSFEQLGHAGADQYQGLGLGLSITKKLVELQGGTINVASRSGQGTIFIFTLPVSKDNPEGKKHSAGPPAEREIPNQPGLNPNPAQGNSILVVDDNHANLRAVSIILQNEGYDVISVDSARNAMAIIENHPRLCLVILDVMMLEMSGYELCREIRRSKSIFDLPVLMLTAKISVNDVVDGFNAGANDYLFKPFEARELTARAGTLVQLKLAVERSLAGEIAFLRAQIKPHFLYNALNTFIAISRYDMDQARELLMDFSEYLRKSFDFKGLNQFTLLKDEVALAKAYLAIEHARFEDRLQVNFELPGNLEANVPACILQPVVENAVIHGILPRPVGGRIEIKIVQEDGLVKFSVRDNGVGMSGPKLEEIMHTDKTSGIGLANISQRLKTLYNRKLRVQSRAGEGTEVSWEIPINQP